MIRLLRQDANGFYILSVPKNLVEWMEWRAGDKIRFRIASINNTNERAVYIQHIKTSSIEELNSENEKN